MGVLLRLILLAVLAWIIFRFLQRMLGLHLPGHGQATSVPGPAPMAPLMRQCSYCKVHIPEGESTQSRGHFFCCSEHRDTFFREHP